ncbi:MAG: SOS response-associated peptidase [Elusimicrobia bacterium]|nr:SOS response-associated peptidase [Candidatus Obscuribacterium magneticum]
MCTRFSRVSLIQALIKRFEIEPPPFDLPPAYNIAPTDAAAVVVQNEEKRRLELMMFGLIPHWAKDQKIALQCLNARAETVNQRPAFRDPFHNKRCLVVCDGFYEWWREGKNRVPYRAVMKDREPYALAGLWDQWKSPQGRDVRSFSIITTESNDVIRPIHNRMPVILRREDEPLWLAPTVDDDKTLLPLLKPFDPELLNLYQVNAIVNSSRNKTKECIEPLPSTIQSS